jgi:hypothetical protein
LLLAAPPELITPVLQVVQRVFTRHLLNRAGLKTGEGRSGAVTLIQRFGAAANLMVQPAPANFLTECPEAVIRFEDAPHLTLGVCGHGPAVPRR